MFKKIIPTLLLACGIGFATNAQITAVSPTGDGGFETGTTFPANGWTVVNPGTPANTWAISNTPVTYAGARCVHVTNTAATPYFYNNAVQRTCHFYRDITIPSGSVAITVSFQWKGYGQAGLDQMLVYTAPTTVTPVANSPVSPSTAIAGATLVWTQPTFAAGGYTAATIALPSSLAGTTFRLIFTWENDASAGITPGGALDNISVTYNCGAPAAITGSSTICLGTTTTLADADPSGTWTSSNPLVATVTASGDVTGIAVGTSKISYTTTCAAPATMIVTVIAVPSVISGPSSVCIGNTITLTNTSLGGAWSSSASSTASVVFNTGVVTGAGAGTATISYSNGCGSPATKVVSVFANPATITGLDTVCQSGTTALNDATTGGTWSAAPTTIATASTSGPGTGLVSGVTPGIAIVTYTSIVGCKVYKTMTVSPLPASITGNAPICVGAIHSISLSDVFPGGVWSSAVPGIASIDASGLMTGHVGGTTTISYSNGCGAATVIASVSAIPTAIVGHDTVCVGATISLADAVIGGTWSSSTPSVATVLTGSGIVTGLLGGAATTITYTMPGGCIATPFVVHVINIPSPITGPTEVCPSATITLSNPATGGVWVSLSPSSASVNASTGEVTGVTASVATIQYTTPAGCVAYANVTVNPQPMPIVGGDEYCAGENVTLYDPTSGGSWSTMTPATATISTAGVMTTASFGPATIKYTLPTTCSITKSFIIKELPNPVIHFNNVANTLWTDSTYLSYQWYHTIIGKITGATIYKTTGMANGSYYVEVKGANGCVGVSNPYAYNIADGVGAVTAGKGVHIFPNPANEIVNIVAGENIRAVISAVDGKTLIEKNNANVIDISGLSNGVYIISMYNDMGLKIAVEKLTKQ